MPEYQLEIKQLVSYPRCRIYREMIQSLIADRGVRTNGRPGLFCYTVLCSYANFRTSYLRLDGISYTIYPGEWICRVEELTAALRLRSRRKMLEVLEALQERHLIQYSLLGRGRLVKYKIIGWHRHNTVLDYNCPCQKETGFFFLPVTTATELVSMERCSEMDILLDLWISAVYRDEQVQGSFDDPVAYLRNGTGCPLVSYSELAQRWGLSKATVGRVLRKLEKAGHISMFTFPGRHGTAIYLQNYLSTMFQISDVMVDKDEVAMSLRIKISAPDGEVDEPVLCGSSGKFIVSKLHQEAVIRKVLQALAPQGFCCANCPRMAYKLYPLSDDSKGMYERDTVVRRFRMDILCSDGTAVYAAEVSISKTNQTYSSGGYAALLRRECGSCTYRHRCGSNTADRPRQDVHTDVRTHNRRDYTAAIRLPKFLPTRLVYERPDIEKEEINAFRNYMQANLVHFA